MLQVMRRRDQRHMSDTPNAQAVVNAASKLDSMGWPSKGVVPDGFALPNG
ncbi:MAG: hypothetical protein R3F37_06470 [Candidatus Competibacteraceae bacterium]